jgi:hypothetical protein
MNGLAQAGAGLALTMGVSMLCIRQVRVVFISFAVQSAAIIAVAVLARQPLLIPGSVAVSAVIWLVVRQPAATIEGRSLNLGIVAGGVLSLLCLASGETGLPLAVVLLSVVLAASRPEAVVRLVALGSLANGIALTGCLVAGDDLLPLACLALPLPLAVGLIASRRDIIGTAMRWMPHTVMARAGWVQAGWAELGGAAVLFVAALTVPLDALASVFAPLIAFDGTVRAWIMRRRDASPPAERLAALLQLGFTLLAVCTTDLVLALLASLAAALASPLPAVQRDRAMLACIGAGLALFGLLTLPADGSPGGYLGLFAGSAMLAAVVPDLAIPLLVVILRVADWSEWPGAAGALGCGVALIALLTCSAWLIRRRHQLAETLLLAQASIAALAIATLQPDGRFAAIVLLVLTSLTRTASRAARQPAHVLAIAGLAGLPPLGVFPGLVLVVLAVSDYAPWLLLPLGIGLLPVLLAGLPRRPPAVSWRTALLSVGWLPLALAVLFGFFAPAGLVRWLSALTTGPS